MTSLTSFNESATEEVSSYSISAGAKQLVGSVVIREQPIEVEINRTKSILIFATPTSIEALVIGLLYSLNKIEKISDVLSLVITPGKILKVDVQINNKDIDEGLVQGVINSTQGISNIMYTKKWSKNIMPADFTLKVTADFLHNLMKKLHESQRVYLDSRGAHGAGIFDQTGDFIAFSEDVGRHNALDKAIGECLLEEKNFVGCGVVLTSRISYEMVAKAARAGLEVILAISAPTTLAIDYANENNITLCGLRDGKINIYTHGVRVDSN